MGKSPVAYEINPPLLPLTRRPPNEVRVAFRSSADTMNQSANDDDDSLLLNLTPLNCCCGRSSEAARTRFRLGHKLRSELFQSIGAAANVAFLLRHKHKQDEWTRRSKVCFRFFLAAVVSDKLDRVSRAKVLTLSS